MNVHKFIYDLGMWSDETFGPGERRDGIIDHLKKELVEVETAPTGNGLSEWVDVIMLAMDGARREGWTGDIIAAALQLKLKENKKRTWPDWRDAEPCKAIEHVREVVPETPTRRRIVVAMKILNAKAGE